MKKFKLTLFSLLAFILGLFCLASCGERENSSTESKAYAGTYKFQALRMEVGGLVTEVKVGQNYGGMVLTEAYAMIELKADGVATIKMAGVTGTGTWTEADEENKIVVTIEGDPMTMTCDGTTIEMDMEGIILVLGVDGGNGNSADGGNSSNSGNSSQESSIYAGVYKFYALRVENGDAVTEIKAGESYEGMVLTEDYAVFELKEDGSASLTMMGVTMTGLWEEAAEQGQIVLTIAGEPQTMTCDGTTLSMGEQGAIFILKK